MSPLPNLPAGQRDLQRRVDQWNVDETLWRKLEPKRRLRRKLLRGLGKRRLRELDQREHAAARPPEDCIGRETPIGFHATGKEATNGGTTKSKRK